MLLPASQYVGASAFTWPAALFLWGSGSWTDLHRHHCVQLVMALDGTLRFRQRPRQRWTRCGAVLVKPDAWHEVDARGTHVLIAFVDAESELGAALAARTLSVAAPILPATIAEWRGQSANYGVQARLLTEFWLNDGRAWLGRIESSTCRRRRDHLDIDQKRRRTVAVVDHSEPRLTQGLPVRIDA